VTLGSFNNPAKLTAEVVVVWSRVLARLPQARLVLKYRWLDYPAVAGRLAGLFAGQGIDPARVQFRGPSPHAELLAHYHDIDLALDPFPFTGGLTTCEALWMGVPVITCPGATFASRHALSHLSSVGLTETIAPDLHDYVERAVALAEDLPRLAGLRARLRTQVAGSPLCDGRRFAANLLALLRGAWRQWATGGR
jgi:predicted O-linked N-acetylglucosamine transferase (SPINDLY family)